MNLVLGRAAEEKSEKLAYVRNPLVHPASSGTLDKPWTSTAVQQYRKEGNTKGRLIFTGMQKIQEPIYRS